MTINALICDDDNKCGGIILEYLLKYCEERNIRLSAVRVKVRVRVRVKMVHHRFSIEGNSF